MPTISHIGALTNTAGLSSYDTAAFTPTADYYLYVVVLCSASTVEGTLTDSQGHTWTTLQSALVYSSGKRLMVFVSDTPFAAVSTTLTYDCTGDPSDGTIITYAESDSGYVVQSATNTATSGTVNVVMPGAIDTDSCCYGVGFDSSNASGLNPPSGWSEALDTGMSNPTIGLEICTIASGETASTITWGTGTTGTWAGVVIEIAVTPGPPVEAAEDWHLPTRRLIAHDAEITASSPTDYDSPEDWFQLINNVYEHCKPPLINCRFREATAGGSGADTYATVARFKVPLEHVGTGPSEASGDTPIEALRCAVLASVAGGDTATFRLTTAYESQTGTVTSASLDWFQVVDSCLIRERLDLDPDEITLEAKGTADGANVELHGISIQWVRDKDQLSPHKYLNAYRPLDPDEFVEGSGLSVELMQRMEGNIDDMIRRRTPGVIIMDWLQVAATDPDSRFFRAIAFLHANVTQARVWLYGSATIPTEVTVTLGTRSETIEISSTGWYHIDVACDSHRDENPKELEFYVAVASSACSLYGCSAWFRPITASLGELAVANGMIPRVEHAARIEKRLLDLVGHGHSHGTLWMATSASNALSIDQTDTANLARLPLSVCKRQLSIRILAGASEVIGASGTIFGPQAKFITGLGDMHSSTFAISIPDDPVLHTEQPWVGLELPIPAEWAGRLTTERELVFSVDEVSLSSGGDSHSVLELFAVSIREAHNNRLRQD